MAAKNKALHKKITAKTNTPKSDQQAKVSSLVKVNHAGPSKLTRPHVEPRELSSIALNSSGAIANKLPPDFLGTAAYLLVAEKMSLGPALLEAAGLGAISFQEHMRSKDGLERLAISQVLVTHGRVMWLSKLLTEQTNTKAITAISASIDSALSTFGRLMRALDEYRRPRSANTSVSIQQANVASNQVVQNIQNQEAEPKYGNQTSIESDAIPINTAIVSANTKRIALTPNGHQPKAPMDKKHGTKEPRRKGSGGDERA